MVFIILANILESAKLCFETQQTELRNILGNATKNLEIDAMMNTACKTVELQQGIFTSNFIHSFIAHFFILILTIVAEFTSIIDSAKMLFESQQRELTNIMEGLPMAQFK